MGGSGDRIEVRDLRVMGVHGVLAEERQRAQPFAVDFTAFVDTGAAGASDALADTVDYGRLIDLVVAVVAQRSFELLEALAAAAAEAVLGADGRIEAVSLSVAKLRPPLAHDVGSVGVRVVRRRTERSGPA